MKWPVISVPWTAVLSKFANILTASGNTGCRRLPGSFSQSSDTVTNILNRRLVPGHPIMSCVILTPKWKNRGGYSNTWLGQSRLGILPLIITMGNHIRASKYLTNTNAHYPLGEILAGTLYYGLGRPLPPGQISAATIV